MKNMALFKKHTGLQFMTFNIWVLKKCFLWLDDEDYKYNKTRFFKDITIILSLIHIDNAEIAVHFTKLYCGIGK